MLSLPFIPETAPFTREQRAWLNGYLAGLFSPRCGSSAPEGKEPATTPEATKPALPSLAILFGSQTGTAEALARRTARDATKRGFTPTVLDMAQADLGGLAAHEALLLIASTYGEGEPPDNAKALHAALAAQCRAAPDAAPAMRPLAGRRFSVCALGDTNYVHFCKCGAEFDEFLEKLGAIRVAPRVDCDLDHEAKYAGWVAVALDALAAGSPSPAPTNLAGLDVPRAASAPSAAPPPAFSKQRPFPAVVRQSQLLSGRGSAKQVYHVDLSLEDSGLAYEAGDALGVYPQNCSELVAEVVTALGCDGEEEVPTPDGGTTSLRHAMAELYDLGRPSPELSSLLLPAAVGTTGAAAALSDAGHVIDLLLACADAKPDPVEFVRALRKLQPRLYSISSSPAAHAGHVHLTVGAVRYDLHGRLRKGVCSTFLGERVVAGETRVGIFVHPNNKFRLPADRDAPIIMIGPGTGIAPFRGFLHERRARQPTGRTWLFFGDQRIATDFLYREELLAFKADGTLTRLDTAFSRDQQDKVYVQHRMLEHATQLHGWLQQGAHVYVCGDASRMARDVDVALHTIVQRAGGKTPDAATEYVAALRTAGRYARDVY